MRIISSNGIKWEKELTCKNCDTKFAVDLSDIKMKMDRINECNFEHYYIQCPTCDPEISRILVITIDDDFSNSHYGDKPVLNYQQRLLIKYHQTLAA